jgi:phage tail tape-measure protein
MSDDRFSKEDLERNEDPDSIAGAVSGVSGAALGGGIGMATLGPIGAVAGALAGAVGGWWAGKGMQSALEDMDRADPELRNLHEQTAQGRAWEEVRHAYQLGYLAGRNPGYDGATFDSIEKELRSAWVQAHIEDPDPVSWDDIEEHARSGFEFARAST